MTDEFKKEYEAEIQALIDDFEWSEEEAVNFLQDRVGFREIKVNGRFLLHILKRLCKIGIPCNQVSIQFIVPESRYKEFETAIEESIAPKGGMLIKEEETRGLANVKSKGLLN